MSNADRIRQMTDEELAERFQDDICRLVERKECIGVYQSCYECRIEWLKQEAKDDE